MPYSYEPNPETSAKAYGRDLRVSPKHSYEIANAIRGLPLAEAILLLKEVVNLRRPIPFRRYRKKVPHRHGPYEAGRFPKKASMAFLRLLREVAHNARYKGLDPAAMYISHVSAYRGRIIRGWMPRAFGRATPWNEQTTNVEIVIENMSETKLKEYENKVEKWREVINDFLETKLHEFVKK
ncbi:MAG: 50S ribosomal protein L22 [Euryarchaeota archaeon]|nr:50S ribosomal protein L22 [Euryarchaeota archaeon]